VTPGEAKIESLFEAGPDAMMGVDQAGVIRLLNSQTELLFGYERELLLGQPVETLMPESFRIDDAAHRATRGAEPTARLLGTDLKLMGRRRGWSRVPVEIVLSSIDTGDGALVITAVCDMTGYRNAAVVRRGLERISEVVEHSGSSYHQQHSHWHHHELESGS